MNRTESDHCIFAVLSAEIDRIMTTLIRRGERVALVNFPNHANAGDAALWLGELASLARIGASVIYRASWSSYRREELAQALRYGGTILLHGGGNFGDLYPTNQAATRQKVLSDFQNVRTIQLPQSIWFREAANRDHLRRLCEAHGDFTLLVRESQSLALAHEHFNVPTLLCPDMVFALGCRPRIVAPSVDVLWLARTDIEAAGYKPPQGGDLRVSVLDWLETLSSEPEWPRRSRFIADLNRRLNAVTAGSRPGVTIMRHLLTATFAPLAKCWVDRGCRILSRGRVVVTDRLHGHILSMMQSIPHVVLDNSYGKIRSMFETWTHSSATAHWARSSEEAMSIARELVGGGKA